MMAVFSLAVSQPPPLVFQVSASLLGSSAEHDDGIATAVCGALWPAGRLRPAAAPHQLLPLPPPARQKAPK